MYYNTRYLTSTVSAVFEHNVSLTDIFASSGTPVSCTSLSTLFVASPAARALLNLSLPFTSTSTFNTLAQLAAPSSALSSLNLHCRYKPQHRGTEVTPYKNNKHCTSGMASGEVADGHKMAVQQAHEMGGLHVPTLGEVLIYTHV